MADIKLYTKVGCPYCAKIRESFDKDNVEYTEIDVHSSEDAMHDALAYSGGQRMVPILVKDGNVSVAPDGG